MGHIKKILLAMMAVVVAIQFIKPATNKSRQLVSTDISNTYIIPENISATLKNACYDCHSNNTFYPWYSNIQPIGWLIARDIKNGKAKVNFSEWGYFSHRKQRSRLQEVENIIKEGKMPLRSYKLMHKNARLTEEDKKMLLEWVEKTRDSIN